MVTGKILAVLFDLDGTLTDTEKYYQIAWPKALHEFGYEMTAEQALSLRSLGRPFSIEQFHAWYGEDFDYTLVHECRKRIIEEMIKENGIPLKEGCIETLQWLQKEPVRVALVTANDRERTTRYLSKIGIDTYFDEIICADMVEKGKPAGDLYAYACQALGIKPQQTIAVEDSPNGIASAYAAGCNAVMIPDLTEPDEATRAMLFARLDSLLELKELLKEENGF